MLTDNKMKRNERRRRRRRRRSWGFELMLILYNNVFSHSDLWFHQSSHDPLLLREVIKLHRSVCLCWLSDPVWFWWADLKCSEHEAAASTRSDSTRDVGSSSGDNMSPCWHTASGRDRSDPADRTWSPDAERGPVSVWLWTLSHGGRINLLRGSLSGRIWLTWDDNMKMFSSLWSQTGSSSSLQNLFWQFFAPCEA